MSNNPLVYGLAGLAIVSIPGLTPLSALQGFQLGVGLGSLLFPPEGPTPEGVRLQDVRVSGASQGAPIPIIYGRHRVGGSLIWASDIKHDRKSKSNGKGKPKTVTDEYRVNLAVMVCKGPIVRIRRIWADSDVIYDDRPEKPGWGSRPAKSDGSRPEVPKWLDRNKITVYKGTFTQPVDPTIESYKGTANTPGYHGRAYVVFKDFPIHKTNYHVPSFSFEVDTQDGTTIVLSAALNDLFDKIGYPSDRRDFSDLDTIGVDGWVIGSQGELRNHIAPLQTAYFFDFTDYDGKLRAVRRGKAVVGSIDPKHMGFAVPDPMPYTYGHTRGQEIEVLERVDVTYYSAGIDFQSYTQSTNRDAAQLTKGESITVPLVLSENQAATIALRVLHLSPLRRDGFSVSCPWQYVKFAPSDPITITLAEGPARVVVVDQEIGLFGQIILQLVMDDADVYTITTTGTPPTSGTTGNVDGADTAIIEVFDVNALNVADAEAGSLYFAAATDNGNWFGGTVVAEEKVRGSDGTNQTELANLITDTAIGKLRSTLGHYRGFDVWDDAAVVDVEILNGPVPLTASEDDVLDFANAIVVGEEILQFCNVFDLGDNRYQLSHLLRGRKGTEYAAYFDHATDTPVVFLDPAAVERYGVHSTTIGQTRTVSLIENGVDYDDNSPDTDGITIKGNSRKPWGPGPVDAFRDGSQNLAIQWTYRSRYGEEWEDGTGDVPMGETTELYDLEIWTAGYGALKRTVSGLTSAAYTYTAADQTTDFGAPQGAVAAILYQVSPLVGRGHPTRVTL